MAKQTFTTGQVLTAAQMTSLQQTAMLGGSTTVKTASYVLVAGDAGTTVAMSAAGATTITVNTSLFSSGDIVFIQNRGAGACTVTAGTATVATAGSLILPQNDAGILYFTATGASIFYDFIQAGAASPLTTKGDLYTFSTSDARLGVGTNTHVLTADSAEATGLKWAAPASGSTFVGANVTKTADQSITTATWTNVTWNNEQFDTSTFHDNSTNNTRLTIPSGKDGKYLITVGVVWATNATGVRHGMIKKNNANYYKFNWDDSYGSERKSLNGSTTIDCVATDYIEVEVYQSSGGALAITGGGVDDGQFTITYLGA